jgi:hypothetical protein
MKAQKIRRQLGGSLSMVDGFPPKPRGMHWKRYERLRQQHDSAARRGLGMLRANLLRLGAAIKV